MAKDFLQFIEKHSQWRTATGSTTTPQRLCRNTNGGSESGSMATHETSESVVKVRYEYFLI
jgi:hypothetical protein